MSIRRSCRRAALALCLPVFCLMVFALGSAPAAFAQYQTPTLDGVISPGEYAHSSGNWSMTWDGTYLYIARSGVTGPTAVYLDFDFAATPVTGDDTYGNLNSFGDSAPGGSARVVALPFRANTRVFAGSGNSIRQADGAGGWGSENTSSSDVDSVTVSGTREIRVRWAAAAGFTPFFLNWLGFDLTASGGLSNVTDPMPAANATGGAPQHYYYEIQSTIDGSATPPFEQRNSTWTVTSNADAGPDTLRDAITNANADSVSVRRYIPFSLANTSINLLTNLPTLILNQATIIDATSQPGFDETPLVVLRGYGTGSGGTPSIGLDLGHAHNSSVKGLVIQNCYYGIRSAANHVVYEANYIGTNAAGTAAEPNFIGIYLAGGFGSIIGCSVFEERNVISGNLSYQILVEHSSEVVISANVIGTAQDGIGAIGGGAGIKVDNTSFPDFGDANVIGGLTSGESNVIGYLTGNAIEVVGGAITSIFGNKIGIGADGTTNAGNGGMAVSSTNSEQLRVGTGEAGSANIIANNNGGVGVNGNPLGLYVRGNSMFANSNFGISLTGSGGHQPAPVVSAAVADGSGTIGVRFSVNTNNTTEPTQSMAVDVYEAAAGAVPQGRTLRLSQCYFPATLTNETLVATGFAPGAKIVLTATAYGDQNCTQGGDGTSAFTAIITPTPPVATTTTLTAPHSALANETVDLTATIDAFPGGTGGTVDFFADSVAISGCSAVPLAGLQAVCATSFAHTVSLTATFSGNTLNLGSQSPAATLTIVPRAFIADGNFSDPTKWSDGVAAPLGTSFAIRAACLYDAAAPEIFGSIFVGDAVAPGSLTWSGPKPLLVSDLLDGTSGSIIDMTNGGTLTINRDFKTAPGLTFARGSGTVAYSASGQPRELAPLAYNHLTINGVVTFNGGTAAVYGTMLVNGLFGSDSGTIELRGTLTGPGSSAFFHDLTVPAGASASASSSFMVQGTMTVNGTFTPTASTGINAVNGLTGNGTVKVTSLGGFGQYEGPKTLTNLTVEFAGAAAQPLDGLTYGKLAINNAAGVTPTGTAHANAILTLTQGIVHTDSSNQLIVDNTSTSAVVAGTGWVTGNGFKRHFATGTNSYLFPVGVDAGPAPATIKINAAGSSDYATVAALTPAAFGAFEPASGIDEAKNVNLYHRIDFGATGFTYDATLNYAGFIDGGATPLAFVLRQRDNATLWHTTTATPAATSITAIGLTSYASQHLLVGNRAIHHFLVSAGTSQTAGATFTTTVTAQDLFNATVNSDSATVVTMSSSTGHAQFDSNGDATFGDNTKTLSSGSFSIATKDALAESVTLTATAGGKTGTSAAITINSASTNTTLLSSLNPSQAGQSVTFTASVTSATAGTITGTVTFKDGVTVLGSAPLSAGSAAFSTSALSVATHLITATYGGDGTFGPSVSNTVSQVVNASAFGAPQLFSATATGTSQVALSWAPVSGATSYEIFRNNALLTGTAATSLNDNAVTANTSYIYKVRALGPGTSAFSTPDAATTIVFTDANVTGAVIKAVHITELRTAVNAIRAVAGLGAASFTDPTLTPQAAVIKAVHITELRTALAAARTSLGVPALTFTDPTLTTGVTPTKAAHVTELRAGTQ